MKQDVCTLFQTEPNFLNFRTLHQDNGVLINVRIDFQSSSNLQNSCMNFETHAQKSVDLRGQKSRYIHFREECTKILANGNPLITTTYRRETG